MTLLQRVCQAFDSASVSYALVGGHAVALHGAVRGTVDIDYVVRWNLRTLSSVESALQELGLESRLPISAEDIFRFREEYISNRNLLAWSFYNPRDLSEQVDILIHFDLSTKKTELFKIQQQEIRVLSKKELIKMKRESGRAQDLEDVAALERLL
jgi:hypothetical protein